MDRVNVKSSNIKSIGHDPATNTMHVEFNNGGVYEYDDVPPEKHAALVNAHSIGAHFAQHIKGQHAYRKIK